MALPERRRPARPLGGTKKPVRRKKDEKPAELAAATKEKAEEPASPATKKAEEPSAEKSAKKGRKS